jgi:hypothetical protein
MGDLVSANSVLAPVKSAWTSKTNWIASVGGVVSCLTLYAPQIVPLLPAPWGTVASIVITVLGTIWARTSSPAVLAPSVS